MIRPIKTYWTIFFVFFVSLSFAQMTTYEFKRELKGNTATWHSISLSEGVLGKTQQDLSDIRIYGITKAQDTIEAPYVMRVSSDKEIKKAVAFELLNVAHNNKGHYFTFEVPSVEPLNQIQLDFAQDNFDWKVSVSASHDLQEWYTLVEDYRILAIKNEQTNFQYTQLHFPQAKYRYYRMAIATDEKPELKKAAIWQQETHAGTFQEWKASSFVVNEHKENKQTEVEIVFPKAVRASKIGLHISDDFDYYRPVTIQYLADSTQTEKGWLYHYTTLTTGTLNSLAKNEFLFPSTTLHKLKIVIENQDNQPLKIDGVAVKGYQYELVTRLSEPAQYYLVYGSREANHPQYDIDRFSKNIPENITPLTVGEEQHISKAITEVNPLFKNKLWLWGVMALVIVVLGWFSLKMMQKK